MPSSDSRTANQGFAAWVGDNGAFLHPYRDGLRDMHAVMWLGAGPRYRAMGIVITVCDLLACSSSASHWMWILALRKRATYLTLVS